MMKKEKTLRMAVTGALLLTVVAAGISMYRTDTTPKKEGKAQQEQAMQEEDSKDVTSKDNLGGGIPPASGTAVE